MAVALYNKYCSTQVIASLALLAMRDRARFSTPIEAEAQDGGPSASGRHLG